MITFFAFQQFSGIFVIFVYAAQFSEQAGVAIDPLLSAVYIVSCWKWFFNLDFLLKACFFLFFFMKTGIDTSRYHNFNGFHIGQVWSPSACKIFRSGNVFEHDGYGVKVIWGKIKSFTAFLTFAGLAVCARFPLKETTFNWIPSFLIIFFIFSATLGFLTLPFSMIAEMFPQQSRGFAAGLTICAGYFMSFLNIKAYPEMVQILGNEIIFLFYGFISLVGIFFVQFVLIETKGKTLLEIENYFRGERSSNDIEMLSK